MQKFHKSREAPGIPANNTYHQVIGGGGGLGILIIMNPVPALPATAAFLIFLMFLMLFIRRSSDKYFLR